MRGGDELGETSTVVSKDGWSEASERQELQLNQHSTAQAGVPGEGLTEYLLPTKGTKTPSAEPGIKTTNWVVTEDPVSKRERSADEERGWTVSISAY